MIDALDCGGCYNQEQFISLEPMTAIQRNRKGIII